MLFICIHKFQKKDGLAAKSGLEPPILELGFIARIALLVDSSSLSAHSNFVCICSCRGNHFQSFGEIVLW